MGAEVEEWAEAKLRGMVVAALLHEVSVGGMVILSGSLEEGVGFRGTTPTIPLFVARIFSRVMYVHGLIRPSGKTHFSLGDRA